MASGSILCPSCRKLVGVNDDECYYCGQKNPGKPNLLRNITKGVDQIGIEKIVIFICVILYVATLAWDTEGVRGGSFSFLSPSSQSVFLFGASGAIPVFAYGNWWSLLSASLLHGGLLHLGLNMYWLYVFMPVGRSIFGTSRVIFAFTGASIAGFFLSSLMGYLLPNVPLVGGAHLTLGASASLCGILGLLVASGGTLGQMMKMNLLIFGVISFLIPMIDFYAHLGGFLAGYGLGLFYSRTPTHERLENKLAILCIFAFLVSIPLSIWFNLPFVNGN